MLSRSKDNFWRASNAKCRLFHIQRYGNIALNQCLTALTALFIYSVHVLLKTYPPVLWIIELWMWTRHYYLIVSMWTLYKQIWHFGHNTMNFKCQLSFTTQTYWPILLYINKKKSEKNISSHTWKPRKIQNRFTLAGENQQIGIYYTYYCVSFSKSENNL